MSSKLERGLFKYDFIDHHAILCMPVDADAKDVRKRYLKIARRLHPDSNSTATDAEKKLASDLLSKLVNPAYEKLFSDKNRTEYMIVLSQMGKQFTQQSGTVELTTDLARQLAGTPNIDHAYRTAIAKIAETQFENLGQVIQIINLVSELNLVYLMRSAGKSLSAPPPPPPNPGVTSGNTGGTRTPSAPPPPPAPKEDTAVVMYIRRAEELISKNQFIPARVELQDALKLSPNNSRCHSLIGVVYLKQNQTTMAKVHFDRALQLDPQDPMALDGKRKLEKILGQKSGNAKPATATASTGAKSADKSGGSGLFGGLFGGKKK
ncbi:J domain-containing protein [Calothrix sp. 336/3]|uniref:J domain-containing protein n=1 Tax=Calothrix sp. 336/3 TaxID=1337936 RepID=UPI0004E36CC8|nr:DnaJ domain-containing protein [Calothrix sp. 336/3]AKG20124.1 molecular chaperone DnaJ [Calothrix sp. 336/3]